MTVILQLRAGWIAGLIAMSLAGATPTMGQPPATTDQPIYLRNVRQLTKRAPDYGSKGGSLGSTISSANRQWLIIEATFGSKLEWADDITLKYHVLVGEGRNTRLLTGELTHSNVKKGTQNYSAMFIHPNVLERYGRGRVQAVAVQLYHQGRLVDQTSSPPTPQRWWEQHTPLPGLLLRPQDTPWAVLAHERYEPLKTP